ncbi:hypothetical protein PN36_07750 [Candidatus Thiomargarita nelsonii]|uniref:Uncharacterized protein n=1 Tax=Candidatus Thiomargarita nelsonii TaxID=1003181 RepID=A0A0A6PI81_9GAMM|nr:hypothetical protein PN36_07750 [Candidatus Thiomargarita nelsonii]
MNSSKPHSAYVSAFLRRHPETAGLLAHSDNPSLLAKTLNKPDCYNAMTRFYALHNSLLTEALDKHRDVMSFLIERGQYIRQRLNNDPIFYKRFRRKLWPAFMRVVHNKGAFDWLVNDPHIWDLLAIDKGAELLDKWGLAPVGLLFGEGSYPANMRYTIGLPFYDSYYALKKMVQGRDLTGGDAVGIGLDALAIVPVAFIAQKVSIISKPLGKTIQKFGDRSKTFSQKRDRTRQLKRGKKTKLPQGSFSAVLHKNQQFLNQLKQKSTKWVSYDVSKFIRFLHKKAGRRGRNTMRFFGLEARVFMRKDAKVVMNPSQGLGGHFFRETSERALNEVLGERAGYALTVLEMTPKVMSRRSGRLLAKAKKKVSAWQQNISAWWLMKSGRPN